MGALDDRLGHLRPRFHADANCREHPDVSFFPERGESAEPALQVCARCIVRTECLEWALADPALDFGVLGGQTAPARKAARRLAQQRAGT